PFTAPHSPPTSIPPAFGPVPGTIASSVLSLHKRDSLYHRRQADKSLTQNQQQDSSLVSSFAFMKLEPVLTQIGPSVARFACVYGRTFTSQEALEKHEVEKRRLAWPEGERREKIFKTPRPQYQEDENLRDICAALARQNYGGE
ncbi:hypothetical protein PtrEW4_011808, partial [Pyrenophora tritici-repentis]